jgi:hypothetical protein
MRSLKLGSAVLALSLVGGYCDGPTNPRLCVVYQVPAGADLTTPVSFSNDVSKIFIQSCAFSSCHNESAPRVYLGTKPMPDAGDMGGDDASDAGDDESDAGDAGHDASDADAMADAAKDGEVADGAAVDAGDAASPPDAGPDASPTIAGRIYAAIVNKPSTELPTMSFVTPGDPSHSYLMRKIDGDVCTLNAQCDGGKCLDTMPQGQQLLPPTTRDVVRRWILQGAPNN